MSENIGLLIQVPSSTMINISSHVEISSEEPKEEKKYVFKDSKFQVL